MGIGTELKKAGRKLDKERRRAGRRIESAAKETVSDPKALINPGDAAQTFVEELVAGPEPRPPRVTAPEPGIESILTKPGLAATILTSGRGVLDDDNIRRRRLLGGGSVLGRLLQS